MRIQNYSFGSIQIDGRTYWGDVVIEGSSVRKRDRNPSQKYRERYGHTPLSLEEQIPWNCKHLIIGTGKMGEMPVMEEVIQEARRRGVKLTIVPTDEAVRLLRRRPNGTNAILHLSC